MALHLNTSNSLKHLAQKLGEDLEQHQNYVFQPEHIVTQTEGMNNWLKLKIAAQLGIAANYVFLKPNDLINKLYFALQGEYQQFLSAENLTWLIYKILGEREFTQRFPAIAAYYNNETIDTEVKRMALAEKVTDLFDQYQIYRTDYINDWNKGSFNELGREEWQKYVWMKAKQLSANKVLDKTNVGEYIIQALRDPYFQNLLKVKIPALHIFGISITTDYHLQIIFEAAKFIDVSYYILNPAPDVYWFEDKTEKEIEVYRSKGYDVNHLSTGNKLLTNWGKVIQDTFRLLFKNEQMLNAYNVITIEPASNETLLQKLQSDIFRSATATERNRIEEEDLKDGSVTINSCFTIAREVEVLYNYLVHLVDRKKEALSPRDIIVMIPDINAYAPYIKAVFKNAPYKFKFSIADESYTVGDSMINALKSVMSMNRYNFTSEEVLQLLDSSYIRKRFGISNIDLIRGAVSRANIKFGIEGNTEDDTVYVSWVYGIKRIMYGICIAGEEEYDLGDDTIFPVNLTEGAESFELMRFCHFVEVLVDSINERKYDRTINEWVIYLESLLHNMICEPAEEITEEYKIVTDEFAALRTAAAFMEEKISYDIFSYRFSQSVSSTTRSGSFAGGGITFCSLIPMRSIPFKVVALMGLNFDKFPRKETALGFDLRNSEKRRIGDRNIKENDKHLFLETILSAEKYLYISYIGQSAKDNTVVPPSALVDELIDYIETGSERLDNGNDRLVTKQPLHSFSEKYSSHSDRYYNYLEDKQILKDEMGLMQKDREKQQFSELSLSSIVSFFKNPFKTYYNKVLNIYYEDEQVLLDDTELFELNKLEEWELKNTLLKIDEQRLPALRNEWVKKGKLPLKNMATLELEKAEEEVDEVRAVFAEVTEGKEAATVDINITVRGRPVTGQINAVYGHKLVFVSYSSKEIKYLIEAYIKYLAAIIHGHELQLIFISGQRKDKFEATRISIKEAESRLLAILELYKRGHEDLLAFHPKFYVEPKEVDSLENKAAHIVSKVMTNFNYPCDDVYLIKENNNGYFNNPGFPANFKQNCEILVKPLAELLPGYFK